MITMVFIYFTFEMKMAEQILTALEASHKLKEEIKIKRIRNALIVLETVTFAVSEVFYFRRFVFNIYELSRGYPTQVPLIIYSVTRLIRIFIDNYVMIVLALSLDFFISLHIIKKKA